MAIDSVCYGRGRWSSERQTCGSHAGRRRGHRRVAHRDRRTAHGRVRRGHWSSHVSEKGVLFALRTSRVFVAKSDVKVVGSLRLATTKPWAIDKSYFTKCERPLYLTAMAVEPCQQRKGIGRAMLDDAKRIARRLARRCDPA